MSMPVLLQRKKIYRKENDTNMRNTSLTKHIYDDYVT